MDGLLLELMLDDLGVPPRLKKNQSIGLANDVGGTEQPAPWQRHGKVQSETTGNHPPYFFRVCGGKWPMIQELLIPKLVDEWLLGRPW